MDHIVISSPRPLVIVSRSDQRKKRLAAWLLHIHLRGQPADLAPAADPPVRVVCVSDTHNTQPVLPPGDVLIHAGDLTAHGSFDELQAALAWLSAQPHAHKIVIAGNHDTLLDDAFLRKHPERFGQTDQNDTKTAADLDWGSVTYLRDEALTVRVGARAVTLYGAPWTPAYGTFAFQYPPDSATHWSERLRRFSPASASASCSNQPPLDILVTHGPPKLHRDQVHASRAGCAYLAEEVARLRPRLCVFGHIHVGYGRDDVVVDAVQWQHDAVVMGRSSWAGLAMMAAAVGWAKVQRAWHWLLHTRRRARVTTFVNAAVLGEGNVLRNTPIVVDI